MLCASVSVVIAREKWTLATTAVIDTHTLYIARADDALL